jgi:acetyl/propionyl-CoA carboxylase alpha subunit
MGVGGELASVKSGVRVVSGGEEREVRLAPGVAALGDRELPFREIRDGGEELVALEVAGEIFPVRVARAGDRVFVWCAGRTFEVRREIVAAARRRSSGAADAGAGLLAPMPGRVRRISIPRGGRVAKGDVVLVLEAMKMEHAIRAPRDGVVTRLDHREGDLVDAGAVLAEIS